jgi:hypothetical protein
MPAVEVAVLMLEANREAQVEPEAVEPVSIRLPELPELLIQAAVEVAVVMMEQSEQVEREVLA